MQLDQLDIPERSSSDPTAGLAGKDLLKVIAKVRELVGLLNNLPEVGALPDLAKVALSGLYADLVGLPTIPAAYTNAMAVAAAQAPADAAGAAAVALLRDGVGASGNTLLKLYNLVLGAANQVNVTNLAARNAYNVPKLPFNIFVSDDGDGKWALYSATSTGVGATFVKLSDPDLLNAVMSAAQIQAAYESNADTFRLTAAVKQQITDAYSLAQSALTATTNLPLDYEKANPQLSFFAVTYVNSVDPATGAVIIDPATGQPKQEVSLIGINKNLFIDTILGELTLTTDASNNVTIGRGARLQALTGKVGTVGSAGSSTAPAPVTSSYSALTNSNFVNNPAQDGQYLTYNAIAPASWKAVMLDWDSGANAGRWLLKLPPGVPGAIRFRFTASSSGLAILGVRKVSDTNFRKSLITAGVFQNTSTLGYVINGDGGPTTAAAAVNGYGVLISDGVVLKALYSVDGVAVTQLLTTYDKSVADPAVDTLYPGLVGHDGATIFLTEYYGFVPL